MLQNTTTKLMYTKIQNSHIKTDNIDKENTFTYCNDVKILLKIYFYPIEHYIFRVFLASNHSLQVKMRQKQIALLVLFSVTRFQLVPTRA